MPPKDRVPGRPFKKGQSGNPKGKPPGITHRKTLVEKSLMKWGKENGIDNPIDELLARVYRDAMNGNEFCMKLVIERLQAPVKHRAYVDITGLPDNPTERANEITKLASEGKIPIGDAHTLALTHLRVAEKMEIQETLKLILKRLEALEERCHGD